MAPLPDFSMSIPRVYGGVDLSPEGTLALKNAFNDLMKQGPSIMTNKAHLFHQWLVMKRRQLNDPTFVYLERLNDILPRFYFHIDMFGTLTPPIQAQLASLSDEDKTLFEVYAKKLTLWANMQLLAFVSRRLKAMARVHLQDKVDDEQRSHVKDFEGF